MAEGTPRPITVGVVGTGFVGRRFVEAFHGRGGIDVRRILTRRAVDGIAEAPLPEALTTSIDRLLDGVDVIFECTGDPVWATEVIARAVAAGLPVVTLNAEFHVTVGSWFVGQGLVTESEGDQPGCLAALREEALEMGFEPLVYGNLKGFLNHLPTPEDMAHWAGRQGISLPMVTAFTDGTKLQVEQALIGNHAGATIAAPAMLGPASADWRAAAMGLAATARRLGRPIADYVLCPGAPHGVFIVAGHEGEEAPALDYFKLGPGPDYLLLKPNIFVHLEVPRTIRRVVEEGRGLLDNSAAPTLGVAAVAKRPIPAGTRIATAIGGWDFRGSAIRLEEMPDHVPIGLLQDAVVTRRLEPGEMPTMADVDLPGTRALQACLSLRDRRRDLPAAS